MALNKQVININFAQGLDLKTDPWQMSVGRFLILENTVFDKTGRLTKRNGYQALESLPDTSYTTITSYKGDLIALGNSLQVYSSQNDVWLNKGTFKPLTLSVSPLARVDGNVNIVSSAVSTDNICCSLVKNDTDWYYQISDTNTGQLLFNSTNRIDIIDFVSQGYVFFLGTYFIIIYQATSASPDPSAWFFLPISASTFEVGSRRTISSGAAGASFDGVVANNSLVFIYAASDYNSINLQYISSNLVLSSTVVINNPLVGGTDNNVSINADISGIQPVFWLTYYSTISTLTQWYTSAYNIALVQVLAPTMLPTPEGYPTVTAMTSQAVNNTNYIFRQYANVYPGTSISTPYITAVSCTVAGVVRGNSIIVRGMNIGGSAFVSPQDSTVYFLGFFSSSGQETYFLIDQSGNVSAKFGSSVSVLGSANPAFKKASTLGTSVFMPYLAQYAIGNSSADTPTAANIVKFDFSTFELATYEIANCLHMGAGLAWMYDGTLPVEHGFLVYPDYISVSSATGSGFQAGVYTYYATYEWTDAQGNLHRSAPSLPFTFTSPSGTAGNVVVVSTLRLTYKRTPNNLFINIYRKSVSQPIPYMITAFSEYNVPPTDTVSFTDNQADTAIAGNLILYTYGGELENIAAPAFKSATIYKSRLFIIPCEFPNQIWFSKQVLQTTPVEFSDSLTYYTGPVITGQDVAGDNVTITSMDDKVILGKSNGAFCYFYGNGPDVTGANNDFSEPLPIVSPVGCTNQQSMVPIPTGIMFESAESGIWLLRRDLTSVFIGADVDTYKMQGVLSSINIPRQNQARFSLEDGTILVYDYFYNQWTTFEDNKAICTESIGGLQTLLFSDGTVRQESIDSYHDAGKAVFMKFRTGWINAAGIQGFERAYYMYILGKFISPHKLYVQIAYDYNPSPVQAELITPIQQNLIYGEDPVWGASSPWGGGGVVEQWRIFFQRQKCQAFQITVTEVPYPGLAYDPGAGLTISSLSLVVGLKSGYAKLNTGALTQIG